MLLDPALEVLRLYLTAPDRTSARSVRGKDCGPCTGPIRGTARGTAADLVPTRFTTATSGCSRDLARGGRPVTIALKVRRFCCHTTGSNRSTFVEQAEGLTNRRGYRSQPQRGLLEAAALAGPAGPDHVAHPSDRRGYRRPRVLQHFDEAVTAGM